MKAMRNTLIIFIALLIITPLVLNSYNINVNRKDIDLFLKMHHAPRYGVSQMRPKNIFFMDGRFKGFTTVPALLKSGIYYEARLECSYNPKNTLFRVELLEKDEKDNYSVISNVSFAGELKDKMLNKGISENMLKEILKQSP